MKPCDCSDCEPACDQYADLGSDLCYECDNDDHLPDRED